VPGPAGQAAVTFGFLVFLAALGLMVATFFYQLGRGEAAEAPLLVKLAFAFGGMMVAATVVRILTS
jgi:hypothetical protein